MISDYWSDILDNWFTHHPPSPEQVGSYEHLRTSAKVLAADIVECCPGSSEREQALYHLRTALMWANAAIACNQGEHAMQPFGAGGL